MAYSRGHVEWFLLGEKRGEEGDQPLGTGGTEEKREAESGWKDWQRKK